MNNELKKYEQSTGLNLSFRWSIAFVLIVASVVLCLQSCGKSNSGGTTGGNPLQSSLPQSISVDAM